VSIDQTFTPSTETTIISWPACAQCTEKVGEKMCNELHGRPTYPVEGYGVIGFERPREIGAKYRVLIEVECHGMKQNAAFDVPHWWSEGIVQDAIKRLVFFTRSGAMPAHNMVTRIK
jgi:hypothetical protein